MSIGDMTDSTISVVFDKIDEIDRTIHPHVNQ